jgi:hypothetical protein
MTSSGLLRTPERVGRSCAIDPISDARWLDLVERAPDATPFHHPLWLALIRDCYRYPITAVCTADDDGRLLTGIPIATVTSRLTGTRLVSVPFSDICGPIASDGEDAEELMAPLEAERRRRGLTLEIHDAVPALLGGGPSEDFYRHVIPLDADEATAVKRVKSSKRLGASRAERSGLRARERFDPAAIDEFFRLHVLTRHKLGVPTQPKRLFTGLRPLLEQRLASVIVVEGRDGPVSAGVFLHHRSTWTYKYGASDPAHLDQRPNDLMVLTGVRLACASGSTALDLGRTESDNDGLCRFKRDFGAEERPLQYTKSPPPAKEKSVRSISGLQRTLIRRTPPAIGRVVGAVIYRHFG